MDAQVDLIVVGSSAVDPSNGARLGKGEGFAEVSHAACYYVTLLGVIV